MSTSPVTASQIKADDRCSRVWDDADLPGWGTAPKTSFWVLLEQPGPWGPIAAIDSHLDPKLGADLDAMCAVRGGRLALIRSTSGKGAPDDHRRHADDHASHPVRVLIAGGLGEAAHPGTPWLGAVTLANASELPALLNDLDLDAAHRPAALSEQAAILAVCTNGRRDACCALRGRPIAAEVATRAQEAGLGADRVWEASHLGGHRFSPTALLLPSAQLLGRLTADAALAALSAADSGQLAMPGLSYERGRTQLAPADQVAEIETRYRRQITPPDALRLTSSQSNPESRGPGIPSVGTQELVVHGPGFTDRLAVTSSMGAALPSSCGKPAEPTMNWQAHLVDTSAELPGS